jgi:acetyl esterase
VPVHPQVQVLLDQMAAVGGKTLSESTVEEGRQAMQMIAMLAGEGPAVETVEDRVIEGVPVRLYRPASPASAPLPVLVWFHGGGWVIGDLETSDSTCRELAVRSQCAVVSVDYRRAPEAPFPAAVDDCWAVTEWVAVPANGASLGVDSSRVAVGGDSAGGNVAAIVAQKAAAAGSPSLVFQLLVYPVTDMQFGHPSMSENAEGYLLTRESMYWFRSHYLSNEADVLNPLASPLLAEDSAMAGVAPALVITAEYDPLRDEGEAYARKLEAAGVPAKATRYDGQIHGFFGMQAVLDDAHRALDEAAGALRAAFS